MGIYIKGMEMPTRCGECKAFVCYKQWAGDRGDCFCGITKSDCKAGAQNADCPLVPVPPHGRLIDADEVKRIVQEHDYLLRDPILNSTDMGMWTIGVFQAIDEAPTIIPAEETLKEATNDQNNS